jgi:hypothetical protein
VPGEAGLVEETLERLDVGAAGALRQGPVAQVGLRRSGDAEKDESGEGRCAHSSGKANRHGSRHDGNDLTLSRVPTGLAVGLAQKEQR